MKPTIASAKNVLPGKPASMMLKGPGGVGIICPAFKMLYDPFDQQKAPAREQMGKAQG